MRKFSLPIVVVLFTLACALPGLAAPEPLPTFDPNSMQTAIVETAVAARTQTALKLPTVTHTATPTRTPTLVPTSTPTFLFFLPSFTPIPSLTPLPTITFTSVPSKGGDEDGEPTAKPRRDPKAMTGKEWTCTVLGTFPPQRTEFKQKTEVSFEWLVFNSGTKDWPYYGLDLIYTGGYRHEGKKIWDFDRSIPSGGEIRLGATIITPKVAGEYSTFFTLQVGKTQFCQLAYFFTVADK